MQIGIKRVKTQALAAPATPAPDVEARDNTDRPLQSQNPNLYYGISYMEYYYFC